jgi:ketosteroid isomerase-like protein
MVTGAEISQDRPLNFSDIIKPAATTDRALIEQRIRYMYERRAANDPVGMYEFAAPDIVYHSSIYRVYPFHSTRRGKDACIEMSRAINILYENLGSEIADLVIDGDRAAFRRVARVRNRGSGQTIAFDVCNLFTFRDGLLVEIEEYPDTQALAEIENANK